MPNIKKNIFNKKKLGSLLSKMNDSSIPAFNKKFEIISEWKKFIESRNIYSIKETALQGKFLNDIFSVVLDYKNSVQNTDEWNLNQEQVTTIDGKFADGSLGYFSNNPLIEDVRVVIELKDANTNLDEKQHRHNDNRTPVEQAFSYQHKIGKSCKWIIVSNFHEIRLYNQSSSTEYEIFMVEELIMPETFRRFYYLLNCENLISRKSESLIDSLYATNEAEEQNISKEFYAAFKKFRLKLYEHIKENNPVAINPPVNRRVDDAPNLRLDEKIDFWELLILEKTQKLLDRFIFICFCEDNRLLPEKTYRKIVETANKSFSFSDTKIWAELKGLFHAINIGSPPHNINKFNGGLFAFDAELDNLVIKDDILSELQELTDYDFESDVDVNILGHIFEQSISDIEEIKSGIQGREYDRKTSKRKKDGIYYTPEYITKYIVENAVGGWLEDRKKELGFYELPELPQYVSVNPPAAVNPPVNRRDEKIIIKKHYEFWNNYKEKLRNIKVLDPACGSGAFLNQAFNYLYTEGQKVNDMLAGLTLGQREIFELDRHILSNNLYGVDLNNESVEITRLSLWLKTANKHSELTALDKNIRCGNSLIDDPEIAGDKAFDWNKEFPEIFRQKELKAYHITWVTYNSRDKSIYNRASEVNLSDDERAEISRLLDEKFEKNKYRVLAINVLVDHVHCLIVCEQDELSEIIGKLKGYSSHELHKNSDNINRRVNPTVDIPHYSDGTIKKLWASGYSHNYLNEDDHFNNTIEYINNNHLKHGINNVNYKFNNLTNPIDAFKPQYTGGFDVVIGNPPYGAEGIGIIEESYIMFYKKSIMLLCFGGYLGFITPDTWSINNSGYSFRKLIKDKLSFVDIYDVYKPFNDAKDVWCHILILKNSISSGNNKYFVHRDYPYDQDMYQFFSFQKYIPEPNTSWSLYLNIGLFNNIIKKIKDIEPIKNIEWHRGFSFSPNPQNIITDITERPIIGGEDIGKYIFIWNNKYLINEYLKSKESIEKVKNTKKLVMQRIRTNSTDFKAKWIITTLISEDYIPNDSLSYLCQDNIPVKIDALLPIINSNLINFYYKLNYTDKNVKPLFLNKIPIPKKMIEIENEFCELSSIMLMRNNEIYILNNEFLQFIKTKFSIVNPSTKLQSWYELSYKDFLAELTKAKVKIPLEEQFAWQSLFEKRKAAALEIKAKIDETDRQIDKLVYELYGLTEEEIKVVEGEGRK